MISADDIVNDHNRRIQRAGNELWDQMKLHFDLKQNMSGPFALKLIDTYGLRYHDLLFLCATHGIFVDVNALHNLLSKREEDRKDMINMSRHKASVLDMHFGPTPTDG